MNTPTPLYNYSIVPENGYFRLYRKMGNRIHLISEPYSVYAENPVAISKDRGIVVAELQRVFVEDHECMINVLENRLERLIDKLTDLDPEVEKELTERYKKDISQHRYMLEELYQSLETIQQK